MTLSEAYNNLKEFGSNHGTKWIPAMAPYKVLSCLDFSNEIFDTTDIDCTQVASDLSVAVIYEEKFHAHDEFKNPNSLQVQKRYLALMDKANTPAFLIFTSRKNSDGIICGTPDKGIDWDKLLGTIAELYYMGDTRSAKEALGNGLADLYSKSNVIAIIPNEAAKNHIYKNKRFQNYLLNYKSGSTVEQINYMLKHEFPNL